MKKRIFIFAAILCIGMVSSIIATAKSSHSEVMTKKADGTYSYEQPVTYWMPFNGGIGFHDADWQP